MYITFWLCSSFSKSFEIACNAKKAFSTISSSEGKEIILLGDTNCDLTTKQAEQPIDNDTKHMTCLYGLFSLSQLMREPIRVTVNSSSIIDHIATDCANSIIKSVST